MEITQEKINLISKIIKSNRKFLNNEDLYDDFLNETCRRSVTIMNTIDNEATLEAYLRKVVTTSIISVLKDSGRLRRSKTGYMTTQEVSIETVMPIETNTEASVSAPYVNYSSYSVNYSGLDIKFDPEENALHNEVVDFIADTLEQINKNEPEEKFMDIFIMRYDKK